MMNDKEIRIPLIDMVPCSDYDNARLNKVGYILTQHIRFYNNLPQSMGGYKLLSSGLEITRSMFSTPSPGSFDLYFGRPSTLSYENITLAGVPNPEINRTPVDFAVDENNLWNFDALVTADAGPISTPRKIIYAHAAPNALDINGNVANPIYFGYQDNNDAFEPVTYAPSGDPVSVSGGVFVTGGYMIGYGDLVVWTNIDNSISVPEDNFINAFDSKIIQGLPTNFGGAPSGLLWTSAKLFRIFYTGLNPDTGNADFDIELIPGSCSIISQNSVVSLNNEFFWLGTNNFFNFNGVLNILPNNNSLNFIFQNLNYAAANKIGSYANPALAEVHWLLPLFGSTENNYDVFYSMITKEFTISELKRSCGISPSSGFRYPILAESESMPDLSVTPPPGELPQQVYGIWQHEYLNDKYFYGFVHPIPKFFQTKLYYLAEGKLKIAYDRLLNNFKQTGNIKFSVIDREFPNSTEVTKYEATFDETTPYVSLRAMGTFTSFRFESNELGGSFFTGKNIVVGSPAFPGVRS